MRPSFRIRRFLRFGPSPLAMVLLAMVMSVVAAGAWVDANRIDPASVPRAEYRRLGATSQAMSFRGMPEEREVVVLVPSAGSLRVLASYLPAPLGKGGTQQEMGRYDPKNETIHILDEAAALQASLPDRVRPWLDGLFLRVLRHEYGHAFMEDWMRGRQASEEARRACRECPRAGPQPGALPPELAPLAEEWMASEPSLYGNPYLTSTFEEYLAESFARMVAGAEVPAATEAFFRRWSGGPVSRS